MARPQKENGFTQIANELLEQIYRRKFTCSQIKLLLAVIRYTYGFGKKTAPLSNAFLANGTGIHPVTVSKEIGKLIERKVLKINKKPSFDSARVIGINKDYEGWSVDLELAERLTVSEKPFRVSREANLGLACRLTKKENNINKTIKKEIEADFVPPTLEEVEKYCTERGGQIDAHRLFDYYTANGWKQSNGNPILDWRAVVRAWERTEFRKPEEPASIGSFDTEEFFAAAVQKSREKMGGG